MEREQNRICTGYEHKRNETTTTKPTTTTTTKRYGRELIQRVRCAARPRRVDATAARHTPMMIDVMMMMMMM
jgi:hypothetical protein